MLYYYIRITIIEFVLYNNIRSTVAAAL